MGSLGSKILDLATAAMPRLASAASITGAAVNNAFDYLIRTLNSPVEQSSVYKLFGTLPMLVSNVVIAIGNFGAGLLNVRQHP
jgi:ABC-type Fe3+ transport system permease subunit